ncbi:uncharacterized protein LOC131670965 isoform X2 [Phymastichus coffea]|uniref:uncharacterized protein LOC131670965 isoform X2 n=1 Tax=Phymastichus coffea TaxID=108790 RepID=UPI00273B467B|nr:uncharacterized protein LOC131670965 isoform X2 [Phymastichus coffea]
MAIAGCSAMTKCSRDRGGGERRNLARTAASWKFTRRSSLASYEDTARACARTYNVRSALYRRPRGESSSKQLRALFGNFYRAACSPRHVCVSRTDGSRTQRIQCVRIIALNDIAEARRRYRLNLRIMERAVQVREARREDCPEIRQLIQELADFEEMPNGPKLDCAALQSDGFERERPEFGCLVAVCEERIVGYALYFNVYTTLDRKAVHLEDLYVSPDFRKRHVGSRLFDSVAKRTFDEGCQYLDFTVLSWNPAQGFYKAKGAVNVTEAEGWHAYRLDRRSLLSLASRLSRNGEYVVREATSDDLGAIGKLAKDAHVTLNVRISKYKKPKPDEISVISADETIGDKTSDDYYGYFVVESRRRVVGYALYCCAYSTWERLAMYLQELHVSPNEHSTDMKVDLMAAVAKRACEEDRCRVDFWVLDPKNDGQFYTSVGATDLTEIEEWNMYRLYELTKKPA